MYIMKMAVTTEFGARLVYDDLLQKFKTKIKAIQIITPLKSLLNLRIQNHFTREETSQLRRVSLTAT